MDGHAEIVEILLEAGADVNKAATDTDTALYGAAQEGHAAIVAILLAWGADVNCAVTGADGNPDTPLFIASTKGHEKVVEMLLEGGADANKVEGGCCALYAAAYEGYENICRSLLAAGARLWKAKFGSGPECYHSYSCDDCEKNPIRGQRFTCRGCPDVSGSYDVCDGCRIAYLPFQDVDIEHHHVFTEVVPLISLAAVARMKKAMQSTSGEPFRESNLSG
jgi:ankyrin repeat protein